MTYIKYPKVEEIIDFNKKILEKIKVKKKDKAGVMSYSKLVEIIDSCKTIKGDIYDKAVWLLKSLTQKHPFESGNRRTAFGITKKFILENMGKFGVKNSEKGAKVLQGVREGYYKDYEIKKWLKEGVIREFKR